MNEFMVRRFQLLMLFFSVNVINLKQRERKSKVLNTYDFESLEIKSMLTASKIFNPAA